jgi:hypothetical protein
MKKILTAKAMARTGGYNDKSPFSWYEIIKGRSGLCANFETGEDMKTVIHISAIWFFIFIAGASSAVAQTQEVGGYTIMRGATGGTLICLGRWVPPRDVALPGVCEGEIVDLGQLSAISAKQSADRLDQMLIVLGSIDQRLAANNDLVLRLIESSNKTQSSIEMQVRQTGELLREAITRRFEELPREILENDLFAEEFTRLKGDILAEVEKLYSKKPVPPAK